MLTYNTRTLKALLIPLLLAISVPAHADRDERRDGDARNEARKEVRRDNRQEARRDDRREARREVRREVRPEVRHDDNRRHWQGDIRHFDRHDYRVWNEGRWRHERHDGRLGWWWIVSGTWYFYPQPIYPYPDPYIPPVAVAPQRPVQSLAPPPPQYWYFCAESNTYYPYVETCPSGWQTVVPTPQADDLGAAGDRPAE